MQNNVLGYFSTINQVRRSLSALINFNEFPSIVDTIWTPKISQNKAVQTLDDLGVEEQFNYCINNHLVVYFNQIEMLTGGMDEGRLFCHGVRT